MAGDARQRHAECRPVLGLAVDGDGAVVAIDDPFHQAEAKARTASARPRGVSLIKPLEHMSGDFRCHPHSGIGDVQPRALPVAGHAHHDASAFGRELDRVVEQIEKQPFQPSGITEGDDGGERVAP